MSSDGVTEACGYRYRLPVLSLEIESVFIRVSPNSRDEQTTFQEAEAMNSLLFLYLNLIRGPQIVAARREKEGKEKLAQLEVDIVSGKVPRLASCKRCDAVVDRLSLPLDATPTCAACITKEAKELHANKMEMRTQCQMSPFLWFQVFIILLGLAVFCHRNVVSLF